MQEEVENRSINLVVTTSRLTTRALLDGLRRVANDAHQHTLQVKESKNRQKLAKVEEKVRAREKYKAEGPHGKQTVKQLVRHSNGLEQIPVEGNHLKSFERVLKKYGVDFAIMKDKQESRYLAFFKAKDKALLYSAVQECAKKHWSKNNVKKPSALSALKAFKQKVVSAPKKDRQKQKDLSL